MTVVRDLRSRQLSAIHAGRKQLGLDDDVYRALVSRFSKQRTESSGEMTDRERAVLLEHMKSLGAGRPKVSAKARSPVDYDPQVAKLRALWISLAQLGEIRDSSDEALASWARRLSGLSAFNWSSGNDLRIAIEALKAWGKRVGLEPVDFLYRQQIATWRSAAGLEDLLALPERVRLIEAQWQKLIALAAMKTGERAKLGTWLGRYGVAAPWFLSIEDADAAIQALARWIKQAMKKAEARDG